MLGAIAAAAMSPPNATVNRQRGKEPNSAERKWTPAPTPTCCAHTDDSRMHTGSTAFRGLMRLSQL